MKQNTKWILRSSQERAGVQSITLFGPVRNANLVATNFKWYLSLVATIINLQEMQERTVDLYHVVVVTNVFHILDPYMSCVE